MTRYAVIDFETTGLSPERGDRAIEIAAVIVEHGKQVDSFSSLIDPGVNVPRHITELTGIDGSMLRGAPGPKQVFRSIREFTHGSTLVAHNASFDRRFWNAEFTRLSMEGNENFVCTMLVSRRLYPWTGNHRLETLAAYHGITATGQHHRALADATMTADLLLRIETDMRSIYTDATIDDVFLARYQRMKRAAAKPAPRSEIGNRISKESKPRARPPRASIECPIVQPSPSHRAKKGDDPRPKSKIPYLPLLWGIVAMLIIAALW